MSEAAVISKPIFGPISVDEMRRNEAMMRAVLSVVRDACKHSEGRFTVESVARGLAGGTMQLYGVLTPPSAELDATVVAHPNEGIFEVLIAGPKIEDVAPFLTDLESYARGTRCERMAIWGPPFFKDKGFLPPGWFARRVRYERLLAG